MNKLIIATKRYFNERQRLQPPKGGLSLMGFTLIEMIIVIVLVGIVCALAFPMLLSMSQGYIFQSKRAEMLQTGRIALERMGREIRDIRNADSLLFANSTKLQFIDNLNRTITFELSNETLIRTLGATANDLALSVSNLSFTYYDASGVTIAAVKVNPQPTDMRSVLIDLEFTLESILDLELRISPRRLQ